MQIEFDIDYNKKVEDKTDELLEKHIDEIGHFSTLVTFLHQIRNEHLI